jgi:hypothetical protein
LTTLFGINLTGFKHFYIELFFSFSFNLSNAIYNQSLPILGKVIGRVLVHSLEELCCWSKMSLNLNLLKVFLASLVLMAVLVMGTLLFRLVSSLVPATQPVQEPELVLTKMPTSTSELLARADQAVASSNEKLRQWKIYPSRSIQSSQTDVPDETKEEHTTGVEQALTKNELILTRDEMTSAKLGEMQKTGNIRWLVTERLQRSAVIRKE